MSTVTVAPDHRPRPLIGTPVPVSARPRGFSLVEIMIVVALLGLVALVVVPSLATTRPAALDLAAAGFADAIRFARDQARLTGSVYGFELGASAQRLRVLRADTATVPPTPTYDVRDPLSGQLYDVELRRQPMASADAVSATYEYQGSCDQAGVTLFDADGVARCGNPYPVLQRALVISFSAGEYRRELRLDGITGRVTVQ